ncbi:11249_t:CDS:1 [Funneliformis geosporum]|uniref:6756_t:CDS:1 n=1 Tax=Funneliformis geosporum TaxID=1117311 RepID=A0A9W4SQG2_9GLOM|nr:11249_t:CDS:1 [Funneliformis geosporum]CAI2176830.1 6756_t:CDS:1 [Funneliformis geosporum]
MNRRGGRNSISSLYSSRESSTCSTSSTRSNKSIRNFSEQYRDVTPNFSTTTADSSSDDEIAKEDDSYSPYLKKESSPFPSVYQPPPLVVVPQRSQPQVSTETPASDNTTPEDSNNQFRRGKRRHFWTPLELRALETGMNEFGTQWAKILRIYGGTHGPLRNRSSVQLKDKARNEKLKRIKYNLDLGIFRIATGGDDISDGELEDDD